MKGRQWADAAELVGLGCLLIVLFMFIIVCVVGAWKAMG